MTCDVLPHCLYCDLPLTAVKHEHDHWPMPQRYGGEVSLCVCVTCHTLKDRIPLAKWDPIAALAALGGLWEKATAMERIYLAKITVLNLDAMVRLEAQ